MSLINDVRKDLMKIISASDKVQDVSNFPNSKFDGYPAVAVTFNGIQSEIATNAQNDRILTFGIHILEQCGRDLESREAVERAEMNIADVVTDLMDRIEDTYDLNGGDLDFTLPVSTDEPVFVEIASGYARKVTLFLTVHKRFNT
jgi:hypothetical protein